MLKKLSAVVVLITLLALARPASAASEAAGNFTFGIGPLGNIFAINGNPELSTDFALVRIAPDGSVLTDAAYDGHWTDWDSDANVIKLRLDYEQPFGKLVLPCLCDNEGEDIALAVLVALGSIGGLAFRLTHLL